MTDARTIPPCLVCRRHTCTDPAVCRRHLLGQRDSDEREVRGLTDDLSAFVLTPAEWCDRYGRGAAA